MKLIQLIKHATCMVALISFMVGCGGETTEELTGEPDDTPPPPGEGPGEAKKARKAAQKATNGTIDFHSHNRSDPERFFLYPTLTPTSEKLVLINGKEVILHGKTQHRQTGAIYPARAGLHTVVTRP